MMSEGFRINLELARETKKRNKLSMGRLRWKDTRTYLNPSTEGPFTPPYSQKVGSLSAKSTNHLVYAEGKSRGHDVVRFRLGILEYLSSIFSATL